MNQQVQLRYSCGVNPVIFLKRKLKYGTEGNPSSRAIRGSGVCVVRSFSPAILMRLICIL